MGALVFRAAAALGHADPDGYPPQPEDGAPDRLCLSKTNNADYKRALEARDAAAPAEAEGRMLEVDGRSSYRIN